MFRNFLAYSIFAQFQLRALTSQNLLCFLEFLVSNKISQAGISNYLSAVKTKISMCGIDVTPFLNPRIRYFNKAVAECHP